MKNTINLGHTKYEVRITTAAGSTRTFWVYDHCGETMSWCSVKPENHVILHSLDIITSFQVLRASWGLLGPKCPHPPSLNYGMVKYC